MRLSLGPWIPDQDAIEAPGLATVRNAIPTPTHYRPVRALSPVSTRELADAVQGLTTVRLANGTLWQLIGTGGRLYRVPSRTAALVDLSRGGLAYTLEPGARWRFAQLAGFLVAAGGIGEPLQMLDLVTATGFVDITEAPQARYLAVVRNQLVAGHVDDEDGVDAYKLRWSGFTDGVPDPTAWDYSAEKLTDFQQLQDVGVLRGITGGEFGTVLTEHGVTRMSFVGSPDIFQFDTIERVRGCASSASVVQYGSQTYYLSQEGWMRFDGAQVAQLGRERVDRWFWNELAPGREEDMLAYADPNEGLVTWLFHGSGSTGAPNRALVYSPILDQWATADWTAKALGSVLNFGVTLDDPVEFPNLVTDPRNLGDPRLWAQGVTIGGVSAGTDDAPGRLSAHQGAALPATFVLPEAAFSEGRRGVLLRAQVLHEGGTARLRVGLRERQGGTQAWGPLHAVQADGTFRFRDAGRFFQLRVELSGDWVRAQAVEAGSVTLGER